MVTYSESGVDIDLEAVTVSKLASKLKSTLEYRDIITDSGHYAALVRLGDKAIAMSTDGVGSKILIAEMMNKYVGKKMRKKSKADREELIASLEKEMKQAARVLDFERAAQLRDMIMEIKSDGD